MFSKLDKTKRKNFFALCDALSILHSASRKKLAEHTGLSYPTVSNAVENLLDMSIFKEKLVGKSYLYSFTDKHCIAIADLRNKFRMVYCDFCGKELFSFDFKESDTFFYDEKLSLFLKSATVYERKNL